MTPDRFAMKYVIKAHIDEGPDTRTDGAGRLRHYMLIRLNYRPPHQHVRTTYTRWQMGLGENISEFTGTAPEGALPLPSVAAVLDVLAADLRTRDMTLGEFIDHFGSDAVRRWPVVTAQGQALFDWCYCQEMVSDFETLEPL